MSPIAATLSSLWGAWRLALLDRRGLSGFNISWPGFIHSFWALLFALPLFLIAVALHDAAYIDRDFTGREEVARLVGFTAGWLGFLALLVPICRAFGLRERTIATITVFNWVKLFALLIEMPLLIVAAAGVIDLSTYLLLGWFFLILISIYKGFALRLLLSLGVLDTVGLVVLEFTFGYAVNYLAIELFA